MTINATTIRAVTQDRATLPAAIGSATVAQIREMLGGLAGNTDRALLVRVNQWARTNGWETGWSGPTWQNKDRTVGVDWWSEEQQIGISRKVRPAFGAGWWHPADWYPVRSVREAIDILVIESVLPVEFASAYAAGRADRAAGGAA